MLYSNIYVVVVISLLGLADGLVWGQDLLPTRTNPPGTSAQDWAANPVGSDSTISLPDVVSSAQGTYHQQSTLGRFQNDYPNALLYSNNGMIQRVYGSVFGYGVDPHDSAERFRLSYAPIFGVPPQDLQPYSLMADARHTLPLGYDSQTGNYRFTLVYYSQERDGLPVFRSELKMLVRNEPDNPLVWVGSSLRALGDFSALNTSYNAEAGRQSAIQAVPGLVNFTTAKPVIWAGLDEQVVTPVAALSFLGDNQGVAGVTRPELWLFVTNAATGDILYQESQIFFTDVTGSVKGKATTISKSDACNPEVSTAMPYAKVSIGGTVAYADAAGTFTIPNSGTVPVTVTSEVGGRYFTVSTVVGSMDTLTSNVTPPGPANFVHNQANNTESIRAQINAYVQANKVRDWVLSYNPSFPAIGTQYSFPISVNIRNSDNSTCPGNAWYSSDGVTFSMNFCQASSPYPNTAYSSVVHHEYGHHLCQVAGTGQNQYGEGLGDCVAMCIADDPILGYGFTGNCNTGIRTANNTMQYPCSSDIHTCAQLFSGCVWSVRNQLYTPPPSTYLSILSNLLVDSIPMHTGGRVDPTIYVDWITLDGIGQPHYTEITNGFSAHNMLPPPVPANDVCANAIVACPGTTYSGDTVMATTDGSSSCGTTGTAPDVWYRYVPATSGEATFSLCTGTLYDSVLSIHTGGCPGTAINEVSGACNDDACNITSDAPSSVTINVNGGTAYLIRVTGWNGAKGAYGLTITGPACAAYETTPPTPNPLTFATPPAPAGTAAITMTATTASDAASPPVAYYFNFAYGGTGGSDSNWQASTSYTDTGLSANTAYTYRVKARDSAQSPNETGYSANASAATWIETPAGLSIGAVTTSTITLNAIGSLTNLAVGSSGVYFDSTTAGGNGGIHIWMQTLSDTATGLLPNTTYTFQVKARNQNAVETSYSPSISKATLANTPATPVLGGAATTSMTLDVLPNGNPEGTEFAIQCTAALSGDPGWVGQYVGLGGAPSAGAVWQNDATWSTVSIQGLRLDTAYSFAVKARNAEHVETVASPSASKATLAHVPAAPVLSVAGPWSLQVDVMPNGNPQITEFAIQCVGTDPPDAYWQDKYISYGGGNLATAVWYTDAGWGTAAIGNVTAGTTYTFAVKARNQDGVETVFGPSSSLIAPWPTGACCHPNDGSCTEGTEADCVTTGGEYQGDTTICEPEMCPVIPGACCQPLTGACTIATQAACSTDGGVFHGWGTSCTPSPCPPPPVGACCSANYTCTLTTQSACAGNWLGADTSCTECPPAPTGACCQPDYTCVVTTQAGCTGTWLGSGTTCVGCPPPPPVRGACCDETSGVCIENIESSACSGRFVAATSCALLVPLCVTPTGACCNPTTHDCTIQTSSDCLANSGNYLGDHTVCTPNPCTGNLCVLRGDMNQDGVVNGLDVAGFVRAKLGEVPVAGENPACADFATGTLDGDIAAFINLLLN